VDNSPNLPKWLGLCLLAALAGASLVVIALLSQKLANLRFEDALIILRYGRNLANGDGFVFNPGDRVLGVTSPLQTIIVTILMVISPDHAPQAVNAFGIMFLVATAWMAGLLVRRFHFPGASLLAGILVVSNLNQTYLYVGMEVPLFAFFILLAFHVFSSGRQLWLGVVLGLAFLTRYDAALLALLMGCYMWWRDKETPYRLLPGFIAVVGPWLVFAQVYFGSIVPTALGAKYGHSGAITYLSEVTRYYGVTFAALGARCGAPAAVQQALPYVFPAVALIGLWRILRADHRYAVLCLYALLHLLTYGFIGADPRFRWHYFILNPVLFIVFSVGFCEISARMLRAFSLKEPLAPRVRRVCVAGISLVLLGPLTWNLWTGLHRPYRPDPHTRDMFEVADWIAERFDENTTLMNPSIGILGYQTGLHMIDHAGLVTDGLRYLDGTRHTPLTDVIESHRPDLILLPSAVQFDFLNHGYRLLKKFDMENPYTLFDRSDSGLKP
jgi:hypothetical protein